MRLFDILREGEGEVVDASSKFNRRRDNHEERKREQKLRDWRPWPTDHPNADEAEEIYRHVWSLAIKTASAVKQKYSHDLHHKFGMLLDNHKEIQQSLARWKALGLKEWELLDAYDGGYNVLDEPDNNNYRM